MTTFYRKISHWKTLRFELLTEHMQHFQSEVPSRCHTWWGHIALNDTLVCKWVKFCVSGYLANWSNIMFYICDLRPMIMRRFKHYIHEADYDRIALPLFKWGHHVYILTHFTIWHLTLTSDLWPHEHTKGLQLDLSFTNEATRTFSAYLNHFNSNYYLFNLSLNTKE